MKHNLLPILARILEEVIKEPVKYNMCLLFNSIHTDRWACEGIECDTCPLYDDASIYGSMYIKIIMCEYINETQSG